MGDAAKRRKRAAEKARETRRRRGVSPWALLGQSRSDCAAYANGNWRTTGLMDLWVFRPGLNGGWAAAVFLIDLDCLGLKDAFVRDDLDKSRVLERLGDLGGVERFELADARKWVAGAIRWTHDHRLRLPDQYKKAVAMLGGLDDWSTADTSRFAPHGKMRFIGMLEDLESRVIGRTPQDFIADEGVEFIMESDPDEQVVFDDLDETEVGPDAGVEVLADVAGHMCDAVGRWCDKRGMEPHPLLHLAMPIMLLASVEAANSSEEDTEDRMFMAIGKSMLSFPTDMHAELDEACAQVLEYIAETGPSWTEEYTALLE